MDDVKFYAREVLVTSEHFKILCTITPLLSRSRQILWGYIKQLEPYNQDINVAHTHSVA